MKILRILLSTSLIFPIALMACSDKCIKNNKNSCRSYNGNNGKNGQNGENGQDGENGGNGVNRRGSSVTATPGQVDESEYKALKDTCRQILEITVSKFCDPSD